MDILNAMQTRHSVRSYLPKPLEPEVKSALEKEISAVNRESGLHFQLVTNEPKAFDSFMAHYGKFTGVTNYIALVGRKSRDLDERCGFYGERLVLLAQQLGLNTCWVAMTYRKVKSAFKTENGEKLCAVIALGYGQTQGEAHKVKGLSEVIRAQGQEPEWFLKGAQAALLAPTAMNQQKFTLALQGDKVYASPGRGFYTKLDLGIVKYHFELGAGKGAWTWESAE